MSGYSTAGTTQELLDNGAVHFLPKPFLREELLNAVSAVVQ
jgi:FixJ family two-component response regulator